MKKLLIVVGGVFAACAIALFIASFYLGSIVTKGVNAYAPKLTGTRVTLSSASISPFSGEGTLRGFEIGNPAGWSDANLAAFDRVHVAVDPKSLVGDHVIINDIVVEAPKFNYETKLVSSNVSDLLTNIESSTAGGGGASTPVAKNGKPIRIEVKHFRVSDGDVRLGAGQAAMHIPLPPLELNDIGTKDGGVAPEQLAKVIMRNLTSDIVRATTQAAGKVGATAGAAAAEGAKQATGAVKNLFGGKKK